MGKSKNPRRVAENEAMAVSKMLRTSPQKLNLVAGLIRNHNLDVDELIVAEAYIGKNLVMKRGRPRARGRYGKILKPFSQITIKVRQVEEQA